MSDVETAWYRNVNTGLVFEVAVVCCTSSGGCAASTGASIAIVPSRLASALSPAASPPDCCGTAEN